jgi:hopanoid biosynthesis associated RND transporter like protein HpnN
MRTLFFESLVRFCCRNAVAVAAVGLIAAAASVFYIGGNFEMDSNSENLLSPELPWRQRTIEFDTAFPQRNDLTLVVIDGVISERAEEAANTLKAALADYRPEIPVVRDLQGDPFFAHNGLLFESLDEVRDTTQDIIKAQPFLAPLAADPSLRGIMDSLSTALLAVENGESTLEDLVPPFTALSDTLTRVLDGQNTFLSWQSLITGEKPTTRETRRLIELQPRLDFGKLMPGGAASDLVRRVAAEHGLTQANGVTVRLTGPVPLRDEEFGTLVERADLMTALMLAGVLMMLWLAVRSVKIMAAILVTLMVGLVLTTALGLLAIGEFNVISVAFIPLFVGIGVDFGIQYSVRYREERYRTQGLVSGLMASARIMGPSLTLAGFATAACFYSFVPTDYIGIAELGFIAGSGMIIAYLLSGTLLPALLKLLKPGGERMDIGFTRLAALDRVLHANKKPILIGAAIVTVGGLALLPFLRFDANPLNLRSRQTESMATLLDLMKDPDTTPNTIEILTPSLDVAEVLARRIAMRPEVEDVRTLESFVPEMQEEKLALIADAALLMDTALNPFAVRPPPTKAEVLASIAQTRMALQTAGMGTTDAAAAARRLAAVLERLEKTGDATFARATAALVPSLNTILTRLRAALTPQMVTLDTLPAELKRDWIAADGRARVQAIPKGDSNDNDTLDRFATAVRAIAPDATGAPISSLESGRTIVGAFLEAGVLSLLATIAMLAFVLKSARDVALTLGPLLAASVLTFATCVVLDLPLNFANIIVLPLLFGIGVAFHIYFIMAWRAGTREFLQTSLTRAVLLSALTTATGFGTLWLSSHPGTASMGELLMISLVWMLITLFVLPTLFESAHWNPNARKPLPAHLPVDKSVDLFDKP